MLTKRAIVAHRGHPACIPLPKGRRPQPGRLVDGKPHVVSMLVYRSEVSTWTMAQAQTICRPFLPPDVIFQRQTTSSNGGLKYVYTSLQLAHTFAQSSPWHDPTGGVGLTYELHDGGVYQCELDESP